MIINSLFWFIEK